MIAHFVLAGQSNTDQWFHAGGGVALEAFRDTFLALNPEYTDVQFFDAARGGSAMLSRSAAQYADVRAADDPVLHDRITQNYWYDETNSTAGPNLTLFTDRLLVEVAKGTEFLGVIWAQGEADTAYLSTNSAREYTEGLDHVLNALMEASGAPQTYIQTLGDRAFYSETLHGGTAAIRDAQQAVADGSDKITLATTIFDLELRDSVHLTDAGYETAAHRMAIAVSTGASAPAPGEGFLLNPHTLLVQIDLPPWQSMPDNAELGGLTLSENGSEIEIVSAGISAAGLLRIETSEAMSAPTLSYGGVEDSVTMHAGDYLYAFGLNNYVPVLPFDLTFDASRLHIFEIGAGFQIAGGSLSEVVAGLSSNDELHGGAGHDTLIGGWGEDTLSGGNGKDVFVLGPDLRTHTDIVTDFNLKDDAIGLMGYSPEGVQFTTTGTGDLEIQTSAAERIPLQGIRLDAADSIRFHTLGTDGDNVLTGWEGNDRIFSYGGDDTIDSCAGTDRITTGDGADVVRFGTGYGTNVVYDFNVGEDSIELTDIQAASLTFRQYKGTDLELRTESGDRLILRKVALSDVDLLTITDAPPTVGHFTGTGGNDVLHGTALDELFESFSGTDRLYGGGGADVFDFRDGAGLNVVYDFEDGQDRILIDAGDFDTLTLLTYKDADAEIGLASGDRLVLRNIDIADITAEDFIFELPEAFL